MTQITIPDEMLPVVTAIYRLGRKARADGVPFENNPYGGKENHRSWNVGWREEDAKS